MGIGYYAWRIAGVPAVSNHRCKAKHKIMLVKLKIASEAYSECQTSGKKPQGAVAWLLCCLPKRCSQAIMCISHFSTYAIQWRRTNPQSCCGWKHYSSAVKVHSYKSRFPHVVAMAIYTYTHTIVYCLEWGLVTMHGELLVYQLLVIIDAKPNTK